MDEQAYQHWQELHRRVVMGETLNTIEQATYEAGCRELDDEERLDGNLQRLRELRAKIAEADAENAALGERLARRDLYIASLEERLGMLTGRKD